MKKIAGDIIILHICTKNHNHMRYGSWDNEVRQIFLSFRAIFLHFDPPPLTTHKIKIFKKWKECLEMPSFYICVPKITTVYIMYASWDMECDRHNCCHFGPFFALSPHCWPRKLKFWNNVKKSWRYYPYTHV